MKKWKILFILNIALVITALLGLSFWVYGLNLKITEDLAQKKFLPPTEFFSAPENIRIGMLLQQKDLLHLFNSRSYQLQNPDQKLHPGNYSLIEAEDCKKNVSTPLPESTSSCLLFVAKDVGDPELSKIPLQLIVLDKENRVVATFQGNPLIASPMVSLEPELIVQFLGDQPIMQTYTPLGQIPTNCMNAVLAIEDPKFLEHAGISYRGIARATLNNLLGRQKQGGSTITQQMVKNYFLSAEKTVRRKIIEFFMSLILETQQSKDQILETYLNIIYMGQNGTFQIRGFPAASQYYFQKSIDNLELSECALLAAILNSPGVFNPFKNQKKVEVRRNLVLRKMKENGMITETEKTFASTQNLPLARTSLAIETAPYYIDAARKQLLKNKIDLIGSKIFTGLSLKAQKFAQDAVAKHLTYLENSNSKIKLLKQKGTLLESSLISADNSTGLISTIIGGRNYNLTQFNRAIDAYRQVGSIIKPFVYLTALIEKENYYNPLTTVRDEKFSYKYDGQLWSPDNYNNEYYGEVPFYFALIHSLNAATAKIALDVGLKSIITTIEKLGATSKLLPVPSISLGSFELSPREVLETYMSLANLGTYTTTNFVRFVIDREGQILFHFEPKSEQRINREKTATLVGIMKQTISSGTAKFISESGFTQPAAGKTGTTSDYKDAWFAGFTPDITTVVWVGIDSNESHGLTGATGAIPIWLDFMKNQIKDYSEHDWN